jgi:hypothetical protein
LICRQVLTKYYHYCIIYLSSFDDKMNATTERSEMSKDEIMSKVDLKKGLNEWVSKTQSIQQFADAMGYKYPNAWGILRGKVPVTVECVGRFVLAYGTGATAEMLALAGMTDETPDAQFDGPEPVYTEAEQAA